MEQKEGDVKNVSISKAFRFLQSIKCLFWPELSPSIAVSSAVEGILPPKTLLKLKISMRLERTSFRNISRRQLWLINNLKIRWWRTKSQNILYFVHLLYEDITLHVRRLKVCKKHGDDSFYIFVPGPVVQFIKEDILHTRHYSRQDTMHI